MELLGCSDDSSRGDGFPAIARCAACAGVHTAQQDSTPLLAITGQVSSALLGTDAFQEIDITGVTLPITKHNYLVRSVDDLPYVFAEALYLAQSGRPGPVLIDLPK